MKFLEMLFLGMWTIVSTLIIAFTSALIIALIYGFAWNKIAPTYMYWLPEVYHHIPYWHSVGILLILFLAFETAGRVFKK